MPLRPWLLGLCAFLSFLPCLGNTPPDEGEFMISFNNESFTIQQILSKYIQIPSESGHEREAGEFLKKLCEENGLYVTQMGDTDGNYNFSASVKPLDDKLPNIVFLNHIDVVPPGDLEEWELPPYSGTITDTEIWGRGAFDNKGTAIMQLFGVLEIAKTKRSAKLNHNVTFLAVSCEETQCDGGIQYVVDNHLEELNPSVVIGEGPPSIDGLISRDPEKALFGISVAHKRALWLKLKLELPTSGHASVTPLAYANKEMVQALNRLVGKKPKIIYNDLNVNILKSLGELEKGPKGFVMKHPRLFKSLIKPQLKKQPELLALFTNTITLTNIDNGLNEVNVIPEKISATLDCRLLPGQETESFLAQVRQTLKNDKINIDIIQEMPMVESTPEESIYYEHLKSAILKNHDNAAVATIFLPNSNDSAYFRAKGVPVFSSVPVKIGREYLELIHNYNERIPKSILDYGKDTYVSFIQDCLSVDDAPVSGGIASME